MPLSAGSPNMSDCSPETLSQFSKLKMYGFMAWSCFLLETGSLERSWGGGRSVRRPSRNRQCSPCTDPAWGPQHSLTHQRVLYGGGTTAACSSPADRKSLLCAAEEARVSGLPGSCQAPAAKSFPAHAFFDYEKCPCPTRLAQGMTSM